MGSEANDIKKERERIQQEVAKEKNPEKRAQLMLEKDEPLRRKLVDHYAQNDPMHAHQRAIARENMERFRETGSTFQKRRG